MSEPERDWQLLALVEVDYADRIQCQCKDCGHVVYKRVHVLAAPDGAVECWGEDCYKREMGARKWGTGPSPTFGGVAGRRLTDEERGWLQTNRERLIARFREEARAIEERNRLAEQREAEARKEREARAREAAERERRLQEEARRATAQEERDRQARQLDDAAWFERRVRAKMERRRSEAQSRVSETANGRVDPADPEFLAIVDELKARWRANGVDPDVGFGRRSLLENARQLYQQRRRGR